MSGAEDDSLQRTDLGKAQESAPQPVPALPEIGNAESSSQPQKITVRDELLSKAQELSRLGGAFSIW